MAGSRLDKFSSIVRRCEGLMKGGYLKRKPMWYDVYIHHPPLLEPTILRERKEITVREIFYKEDIAKAEEHNRQLSISRDEKRRLERNEISQMIGRDSPATDKRDSSDNRSTESRRFKAKLSQKQKQESEMFDFDESSSNDMDSGENLNRLEFKPRNPSQKNQKRDKLELFDLSDDDKLK